MARQPRTRRPARATTEATETVTRTDTATTETRTIPHLDLAAEALIDGWTREHVIAALIGRIKRDQGYLAYRKACNRRTSYDTQVQHDMRSLALAACWLEGEGDGGVISRLPPPTSRHSLAGAATTHGMMSTAEKSPSEARSREFTARLATT